MTADDRKAVADLALRALDAIDEDYGEDAELLAATLVFEVKTIDPEDDEPIFHGHYKSLDGSSPYHTAGLLRQTAAYICS